MKDVKFNNQSINKAWAQGQSAEDFVKHAVDNGWGSEAEATAFHSEKLAPKQESNEQEQAGNTDAQEAITLQSDPVVNNEKKGSTRNK